MSADELNWVLVNASPDIARQIESLPYLHPRGSRHSPIQAIVLTSGHLEHVLGLFSLRHSFPLTIYATQSVWRSLTGGNTIYQTLQRFPQQVTWRKLEIGKTVELAGISLRPFAAPTLMPTHLKKTGMRPSDEDNIGLEIRDPVNGRLACYAPTTMSLQFLRDQPSIDCLLLDGTFWSSDEMERLNVGKARAEQMGHTPIFGPGGSLEQYATLTGKRLKRKVFTHMNNTNPILLEDSPERQELTKLGWEVAYDGMAIAL
jgi:pyrroloquinoline quinone biosynthesis protein B